MGIEVLLTCLCVFLTMGCSIRLKAKEDEALRSADLLQNLFEEDNIWRFIKQMSSALKYLHIRNILHRDLKVIDIKLKQYDKLCLIFTA